MRLKILFMALILAGLITVPEASAQGGLTRKTTEQTGKGGGNKGGKGHSGSKTGQESKQPKPTDSEADGMAGGYGYVDLGLPSGTKWAVCNVGASSPTEYGKYYAWGETATKSAYSESNSMTYKKNVGAIAGNPEYDSATANWGASWRMPSRAEFEELISLCKWQYQKERGKEGYRATGPNGKSIFFPAGGYRREGDLYNSRSDGFYWSSTSSNASGGAYTFLFSGDSIQPDMYYRSYGFNIRPVRK